MLWIPVKTNLTTWLFKNKNEQYFYDIVKYAKPRSSIFEK